MTTGLYKKGIALAVVTVFILTGLTSVYAELLIDKPISIERTIAETAMVDCAMPMDKISTIKIYNPYEIPNPEHPRIILEKPQYPNYPISNYTHKIITVNSQDPDWNFIVPDDYPSIQLAVNMAEPGYRILVRTGVYDENVIIDVESIVLHGEDKDKTIISGDGKSHVIEITGMGINISGFTIRNSGLDNAGIYLDSDYNIITDNIIKDNDQGLMIQRANGNHIISNTITSNSYGAKLNSYSHANNITGNTIQGNTLDGITIENRSTYNIILDNIIRDNSNHGVLIDNVSRNNMVTWNDIRDNSIGIDCHGFSDGNLFHHNTFIDNDVNAFDSSNDTWDNGMEGNYWSDYTGFDSNGDGIGDTPYIIPGGDNLDNYPLIDLPLEEILLSLDINEKHRSQQINEDNGPSESVISGDTIFVPDDYPTIQDAVDHAVDGDTIHVRSGTYYEHVIVDKQLKIEGDEADVTIVDGESGNNHVFCVKADGVVISDFTIRNCSVGFSGIRVYGCCCNIHDNLFTACGGGVELWSTHDSIIQNNIMAGNVWGVYIDSCSNCQVENNSMINNIHGMELGLSNLIKIMNNVVENNSLQGILYLLSDRGKIQNNIFSFNCDIGMQIFSSTYSTIQCNTVENNTNDGISFSGSSYNIFSNNKIYCNEGSGVSFWFSSDDNRIEANLINSNIDYGVFFSLSNNNRILENEIFNNWAGIHQKRSFNNSITGNNLSNVWAGVDIWYSSHNEINRNAMKNNEDGIRLWYSSNNIITENYMTENNGGILLLYSSNNNIEYNNIANNTFMGISLLGNSTHNCITLENNITDTLIGIFVDSSSNNFISGNYITRCNVGGIILQLLSDNNIISENNIVNSNNCGIVTAESCENNTITGNTIENITENDYGHGNGIILANSSNSNTVSSNIIKHTSGVGIGLWWSTSKNLVSDNKLTNIGHNGIYMHDSCCDNIIRNNNIFLNEKIMYRVGIGLLRSSNNNNEILYNKITNYYVGISLENSSNFNTFSFNEIIDSDFGVYIEKKSSGNIISKNTIMTSNDFGISLYKSNNNIIYQNNIIENDYQAFFHDSIYNHWWGNYWSDHNSSSPRLIYGKYFLKIMDKDIYWFNFDWRPAQEPYQIEYRGEDA